MDTKETASEGRAERKKKETRQKIVEAAMALFQRQGFNDTTMEQIAEEVDIARKTLYNYFPVKEAIADEYVRGISQRFAEESNASIKKLPDTRSRLLAALNNAYDWVEHNKEITGIVLAYRFKTVYQQGQKTEKTGTYSLMKEIIRLGQQEGDIKSDISAEFLVTYLDMLRGTMVCEWLKSPTGRELREEIIRLVDLVLYGASTGKRSVD